ncbi:hypothetical protein [Halapricum desulfuricans]|uniref:Uncharacterized protein n=1 Tax=Halapricum desulfuricans TaxID=2841257 RepID=A0A897N023_9EURY|nr:hypothetical protein [Halapricum desulfuricans]QSG06044.1 hypothetical protein HSR121_1707 [Halapricum desulfuricans]
MSERYGDERIVDWLAEHDYHPRSNKHGSASCMYLLDDMLAASEVFRDRAQNGEIVYAEDYTVGSGDSKWNVDLVVGPPGEEVQTEIGGDRPIVEAEPEEIWLAVDAKSVMTEHGKARRNRQRDINSFADIMHQHYPGAVTGGVLLINMADRFKSPLRDEGDVTNHDRIEELVAGTVDLFRDIERAQGEVSPNVDGVGCIVVEHTNMDDDHGTRLVTEPPAPQPGDIVYYEKFVEIILETLEERWLTGDRPDISSLVNADLRAELNAQIVELASVARKVGVGVEESEVSMDTIEDLREEISELSVVLEEIERQYH